MTMNYDHHYKQIPSLVLENKDFYVYWDKLGMTGKIFIYTAMKLS
jgi:hypothetical protein